MAKVFFGIHVAVLVLGLLAFLLAVVAALLYFFQHRQLKAKRVFAFSHKLPSLEQLDGAAHRTLLTGFLFLTLGMFTGLYLAHTQWKGEWIENPKFLFSIGVWIWYVFLLGIRRHFGLRGGRFFAFILIGFLLFLFLFVQVWLTSKGMGA